MKSTHKRPQRWAYAIIAALLSIVLILALLQSASPILSNAESEETSQEANQTSNESNSDDANSEEVLTQFESAIFHALDEAHGAVVSIENFQDYSQFTSPYEYFFEFDSNPGTYGFEDDTLEPELILAGEGSGVIYKVDGDVAYVITNNHVIEGAEAVDVTTREGETVPAEIIGHDMMTDLAVLKIDSSVVNQTIEFADSDEVRIGSLAIAIGSPLGSQFASSVTQGIVSAVNREVGVDTNGDGEDDWTEVLLQTDAAINPGNSGGALVDRNGRLIGINSSKFSSIGVEGMGFAIPSNQVKFIVEQLEANGEVQRPVLGIRAVNVERLPESFRMEYLNLPEEIDQGVAIQGIEPNSAADSQLEVYDVIVAIDGESIENMAKLRQVLYNYQVDDTIQLTVVRSGFEVDVEVTLQPTELTVLEEAPESN